MGWPEAIVDVATMAGLAFIVWCMHKDADVEIFYVPRQDGQWRTRTTKTKTEGPKE